MKETDKETNQTEETREEQKEEVVTDNPENEISEKTSDQDKSDQENTDQDNADDEIQKLSIELQESKDKYLRLYSEFENFRRRTAKEKLDLISTANEELMTALLPVLDDFERANKSIGDSSSDEKSIREGIDLVYTKFRKTLEQKGLKAMNAGEGSDFDPDFHEAITQIPAPSKKLKGKVVDVIEKGFLLKEKVIRFAKVVIGS